VDETTLDHRFILRGIEMGASMSSIVRHVVIAVATAGLIASTAGAQLLPSMGIPVGLPSANLPAGNIPVVGPVLQEVLASPDAQQAIGGSLDSVAGLPASITQSGSATLLELRRLRLQQLIRENRRELESDGSGQPVRRGVLIAINPDPASLLLARRAGFNALGAETYPELNLRTVTLAVPGRMSARDGLRRLHAAAPNLAVDLDHLFEPAGGPLLPFAGALAASSAGAGAGLRIGMVDGGVASHPSLAQSSIEQRGFSGNPQPTGHGTAVASLIVGNQGPFRGAAQGAALLVADIYGGNRAAGSASAVARSLGWLVSRRPAVITISLVGPSNGLVAAAVQRVQARGIHVVAAVGNDGPAAPPQFPASYPGVIAVTGVDARGRALVEAGKATHLDFAAPGADMAAALPGQGYARVRGTSFAAPLAAARLAQVGSAQRLAAEARRGKGRVGRGIVCGDCRVDPRVVRAK
jgi:subtilisin family serine protease